ncbi:TPA: hypothetical protein ACH3X2_005269 [Trebouxia sp. C0005]
MKVSQGSHLSSHVVPRSLPPLVPASQNAVQPQAVIRGPGWVHRYQQIHRGSYQFSDRRASRLVRTHDSASSTWPSESAEALDSSEAVESIPDTGNGISKSDLENSTDEAATRVGLSSKGSKKIAGFWGAYSKALEEHPIRVKSATSFFGFLLGDAVAQLVVGNPYNYLRTARMVIFGILMDGPIGHLWYTFLDGKVYPEDPKSNKAVISKMLCDQLLWAPFFSCVFFAVIKTLEVGKQCCWPCTHSASDLHVMAVRVGIGMRLSSIVHAPLQLHIQLGSRMSLFLDALQTNG